MDDTAKQIVQRFRLTPHPEGGFFREVYRSDIVVPRSGTAQDAAPTRCAGTLIYFLLAAGHFSAFHRVRGADEIWHLYAGGPLELHLIDPDEGYAQRLLTTDPRDGEPAAVVAAGCWQAARPAPASKWVFVGCTVSPGFEFSDFDLPPAAELVDAYPEHAAIIRELTRR